MMLYSNINLLMHYYINEQYMYTTQYNLRMGLNIFCIHYFLQNMQLYNHNFYYNYYHNKIFYKDELLQLLHHIHKNNNLWLNNNKLSKGIYKVSIFHYLTTYQLQYNYNLLQFNKWLMMYILCKDKHKVNILIKLHNDNIHIYKNICNYNKAIHILNILQQHHHNHMYNNGWYQHK